MERLGREEKSARALVKKMDKTRKSYYEFFTDEKWKDLNNYQMCIDTSRFDQEFLLKILADIYAALYAVTVSSVVSSGRSEFKPPNLLYGERQMRY